LVFSDAWYLDAVYGLNGDNRIIRGIIEDQAQFFGLRKAGESAEKQTLTPVVIDAPGRKPVPFLWKNPEYSVGNKNTISCVLWSYENFLFSSKKLMKTDAEDIITS
jgi:hypothetical protein